jgi:hypothetical protein
VDQLLAAHARVKDAVMRAVESERGRRPASLLREVRETYRICERDAGARFLNVDRELKRLCEQLRALHGPMNDLARALTLVTA